MNLKDILNIINGKLICGNINKKVSNFSKDTRTINENDLYFGIKGDNYDGNKFYLEAIKKGAIACIVDNKNAITKKMGTIILVEDTIKALHLLAAEKMKKYNIPVIAVTGSVGKTTTKELIYNVLKDDYKILKTEKNYNGQIGLPLTVLKLKDEEILLVEMGMNEQGAIEKLSKIVKPDIAVITNIGTSHIGILKTKENILKAKLEILKHMNGNTLILNNDDILLSEKQKELKEYNIITYSINNESKYKANEINILENKVKYKIENELYEIPMNGKSTIYNSIPAIIIGEIFKIKKIKQKLKNIKTETNRLEIIKHNNIKIINDCYNASYESIMNAIEVLKKVKGKRKIVVLGDILELGEYEEKIHSKLGTDIDDVDILISIGNLAKYTYQNSNIEEKYYFKTKEDALIKIKSILKEADVILVKASNSMNFKYIVEEILKKR